MEGGVELGVTREVVGCRATDDAGACAGKARWSVPGTSPLVQANPGQASNPPTTIMLRRWTSMAARPFPRDRPRLWGAQAAQTAQ